MAGESQPENILGRGLRLTEQVVAGEYLLLTAAIESNGALNAGLSRMRRQLMGQGEPELTLLDVARETADEVVAPFTTNYRWYRNLNAYDEAA